MLKENENAYRCSLTRRNSSAWPFRGTLSPSMSILCCRKKEWLSRRNNPARLAALLTTPESSTRIPHRSQTTPFPCQWRPQPTRDCRIGKLRKILGNFSKSPIEVLFIHMTVHITAKENIASTRLITWRQSKTLVSLGPICLKSLSNRKKNKALQIGSDLRLEPISLQMMHLS